VSTASWLLSGHRPKDLGRSLAITAPRYRVVIGRAGGSALGAILDAIVQAAGAAHLLHAYAALGKRPEIWRLAADGSSQAIWCGPVPPVRFYGFVG
jgi:hypothetical protein